jgi:TonB family protein
MRDLIKAILLFVLLATFVCNVNAQTTITGRVIDTETKNPVAEATISIEDKETKVTTNYKGFFQIAANEGEVLVIESADYQTKSVLVTAAKAVQVSIRKNFKLPYEGGNDSFYKSFFERIQYPKAAREDKREGIVYVTFMVDITGQISNVNIIKDIGRGCGDEVVKVLKKVPNKWINSEPMTFIFPVTFRTGQTSFTPINDAELPAGKLMTELVITAYQK